MEKKLKGGWGVVMDDVVAGAMANIVLQIGLVILV
jgi:phosphatidylglycerophosphatase A